MMECQWQQQDGGKNELAQNWWLEVLATPDPSEGVDGDTPSSHEVMHEASRQFARARLTFPVCIQFSTGCEIFRLFKKKGTKWVGNKVGRGKQRRGGNTKKEGGSVVVEDLQRSSRFCSRSSWDFSTSANPEEEICGNGCCWGDGPH